MPNRRASRETLAEEAEESRMLERERAEPILDDQALAAIQRRCRKATPGPWDANGPQITSDATDELLITLERYRGWEWDAEFIASARDDVPLLLAEVARLRATLEPSR